MTYTLHRLSAGNYDLLLGGIVIGSVVRSSNSNSRPIVWRVELAADWETWPAPFTAAEHEFASLDEAREWLDGVVVADRRGEQL